MPFTVFVVQLSEQQLHETIGQQQGFCNKLRLYGYMYGNPSCIPRLFQDQANNTGQAEYSVSGTCQRLL